MSQFKFNIPSYDKSMVRFIDVVVKGFFALDPVFGKIGSTSTKHQGPIRNVRGSTPLDQNMSKVEFQTISNWDAIRETDIEDFTRFLHELADGLIKAFEPEFYKGFRKIMNVTESVVDAGGKPLSFDLINDGIEKIHIDFDENGEPRLPTMIIHPQTLEKIKNIKPTPEQEERHARMLAKKKAEFYAKKRTRRLS